MSNLPIPFAVEFTTQPVGTSKINHSIEVEAKLIALFKKEGILSSEENFDPKNIFRFCCKGEQQSLEGYCRNKALNCLYYLQSLGWVCEGSIAHVIDCFRDKKWYTDTVMCPHISPNTQKEILEALK